MSMDDGPTSWVNDVDGGNCGGDPLNGDSTIAESKPLVLDKCIKLSDCSSGVLN